MPYDPNRHHRRSIRLKGYDYTQPGAYFVTLVTHERMPLFGDIVDGEMRLNEYGEIVHHEWFQTAVVRPYVVLHTDEFVVMPNHVHGIIWIVDTDANDGDDGNDGDYGNNGDYVGAQRRCAPTLCAPTSVAHTSNAPTSVAPTLRTHTLRANTAGVNTPGTPTLPRRTAGGVTPNNVIPGSLGAIVRSFKSITTRRINTLRSTPGAPIWQRNYYEHIIRNEQELNTIRQYIIENPRLWHLDRENIARTCQDLLEKDIWDMFQYEDANYPAGGDL